MKGLRIRIYLYINFAIFDHTINSLCWNWTYTTSDIIRMNFMDTPSEFFHPNVEFSTQYDSQIFSTVGDF